MKLLIINGPNINMLGIREPGIYGKRTFHDLIILLEEKAAELADLVDSTDFTDEKMTEFMQNAGVNLEEVTLETMLQFRSFYLGNTEE